MEHYTKKTNSIHENNKMILISTLDNRNSFISRLISLIIGFYYGKINWNWLYSSVETVIVQLDSIAKLTVTVV